MPRRRRLLSALMFSPRGGSSHVARAFALQLPSHDWDVTLLAGSRTDLGELGDATRFYAGLDVHAVSFDDALGVPDPLAPGPGAVPIHPSYEDRPGAPDRVFAALDDDAFERQVQAWGRALSDARAADADALQLHHLTPINEAAARVAPDVPVIGHLHGTELLMLEEIANGAPPAWAHAQAWVERMRAWARRCERLIVLSPSQIPRAERLLGVSPDRLVVLSNGFDPQTFRHRNVDRAALWHEALVGKPRGWLPGGRPGSVRYSAEDLAPLADGVTVLTVSRFTEVKRLPLLIEAFARARGGTRDRASLVIIGGHPGEWEGEHPADTVARIGVAGVFLAGWYDHTDLPRFLSAADVFALASVREQFGQVLVEAMACGLPVVAVNRLGPSEIVRVGQTGWLAEPDDVGSLSGALRDAIDHPEERKRRGTVAQHEATQRYGWPSLAGRLADVLDGIVEGALTQSERAVDDGSHNDDAARVDPIAGAC